MDAAVEKASAALGSFQFTTFELSSLFRYNKNIIDLTVKLIAYQTTLSSLHVRAIFIIPTALIDEARRKRLQANAAKLQVFHTFFYLISEWFLIFIIIIFLTWQSEGFEAPVAEPNISTFDMMTSAQSSLLGIFIEVILSLIIVMISDSEAKNSVSTTVNKIIFRCVKLIFDFDFNLTRPFVPITLHKRYYYLILAEPKSPCYCRWCLSNSKLCMKTNMKM